MVKIVRIPVTLKSMMSSEITVTHLDELRYAKSLLENPGLAIKLSGFLGSPIEKGMDLLPANAKGLIFSTTTKSLEGALKIALYTLSDHQFKPASNTIHKLSAAMSGGVGGAFGLAALSVELPVSTGIMLRSIADIARSEQQDLQDREAQLACMEVFALGSPATSDDAANTGYFSVRLALAQAVTDAATYAATKHTAVKEGASVLTRLISLIASRFSIPVTEKVAAQAVPILGAASGALINTLFIAHYQNIARGHFIVRRLESVYGAGTIRAAYEAC